MVRLRDVLPGALALVAALGAGPPVWAGPAMSEWSRVVNLRADGCAALTRKVMADDGWTNIQKGDGDLVMADKGPLSGVVMCLGGGLFDHHCTAVIVVAGGDDDAAATEADRLRKLVTGK